MAQCNMKAGIILSMRPANGRWRYKVTSSPIGWAHTENDPCDSVFVEHKSDFELTINTTYLAH